jgi:hypothetical protein
MNTEKYILYLTASAKVRRFQYYGDEQGMLGYGDYMVKIPKVDECSKKALLVYAFKAAIDNLELPFDTGEFVNYNDGSSELCKNKAFCNDYENLVFLINQLDISRFHFFFSGSGAWLALLSFGLVYFSWWFLFAPFLIWGIATASNRVNLINWSASYAILSKMNESFYKFCKKYHIVEDFPDDMNKLTIIGDAFGSKNLNIRMNDEWDTRLLLQVNADLNEQKIALNEIYSKLLMKSAKNKLHRDK